VRFCHLKMFSIRAHRTVPQGLLFLSFILVFVILCLNVVLLTLSPNYTTYGNQMYSKGVASQWSGDAQCIGFAPYPSHAEQCSSAAPQYQLLVNTPAGCNPNPNVNTNTCTQWQVDIPLNKENATAYTKGKNDWSLTSAECTSLLDVAIKANYPKCAGVQSNQTLAALLAETQSCEISEPCLKTRLAALLSSFFYNFWFLGFCYYWANWGFIGIFFISLIWCTCKRRKSLFQALVNDVESDLLGDDDDDMTPFKPSWMA